MISTKKLIYKIIQAINGIEVGAYQPLLCYPVGFIYMSVDSTNPANLFGGTWVAWGSGRVPVGVDTNDIAFDTVEKTGGEKTVTLTTEQIPSHKHSYPQQPNAFYKVADSASSSAAFPNANATPTQEQTSSTGGGQAHNNLQPYITCYMFKRTA